jgi:shikimate dehydrogenase
MGIPYAEVIGDPVAHSKSPLIHRFWLERLGIEGEYRRTRVCADELAAFLARRRSDPDWRGCNVTIPHKRTVVPLLDEIRIWGVDAVNCVAREDGRLVGYNTDMGGIGKALPDRIDKSVPICIVGAGGAASAAVAELDIGAAFQFNVIARDLAQARALVAPYAEYGRVFGFDSAEEAMRGCAGLINASPLGMDGFDSMPVAVLDALPTLSRRAFVVDLVYAPLRTELLCRAAALRYRTADGLAVLIGQAEDAFRLLFGAPPPDEDRAELRALLTS